MMSKNLNKIELILYSKPDCSLCQPFLETVVKLSHKKAWQDKIEIKKVNIEEDAAAFNLYHEKIPVLEVNGRLAFKYFVTEIDLEKYLLRVPPPL